YSQKDYTLCKVVFTSTPLFNVWYTTQYRSVNFNNVSILSGAASDSILNCKRIDLNPTGTSFETPNVPLKSRSPSAVTVPFFITTSIAVATAFNVTPAQATKASSNISPEHANIPEPPVAGCKPASTIALPVSTLQEMPSPIFPVAFKVMIAEEGSSLYCSFNGAWINFNSAECMLL